MRQNAEIAKNMTLNQRVLGSSPSASTISSAADVDYHYGMRVRVIVLSASLSACTAAPPPPAVPGPMPELAGRVEGPAQRCVTMRPTETLRPAESDRHTLIYTIGSTIWANHIGACSFDRNDALLIERTGSDLCRGEIVRSFDPVPKIPGPACILGDFVPYTR